MMRPWKIWSAFIACLAIVIAAVGWMSFKALEADDAEAAARQQAALEENGRLALWRMDSIVAPLIARENAQAYINYNSFIQGLVGFDNHIETHPSPLLVESSPDVLLHFQIGPDGRSSSPSVPTSDDRKRTIPRYLSSADARKAEQLLEHVGAIVQRKQMLALLASLDASPTQNNVAAAVPAANVGPQQIAQEQRWNNEYQARSQFVAQNAQNPTALPPLEAEVRAAGTHANALVQADMMTPVWVANQLILVRRLRIPNQGYTLQGCLLDWPTLEKQLLHVTGDLLLDARLSPVTSATPADQAHMLASLPVRLDLGTSPATPVASISPVRLSLIVAWIAMALAALAVAVLLRGVLSLSERRATFVSAVTHELRTPLTTFRMYSEMLADDMVPDEASRRNYLQTLRVEADRLTHLVENVLSYARLERGRPGGRIRPVAISEILELATDRLSDRARQAGFELVVEADDAARKCRVLADPAAIEQILFNLVDNACKYAATATDRTLHLEPQARDGQIWLRLRDHGPGISADQRRVLFQPFRKSADEAAHSAPGVGLGLALCRRLARDMGGDLVYEPSSGGGACFALRLRAANGAS